MQRAVLLAVSSAIAIIGGGLFFVEYGVEPPDKRQINELPEITNLVPNEQTAVTIAKAVLIPIYGERQIAFESPLKASLQGSLWVVKGQLPDGYLGSIVWLKIAQSDARIISICHSNGCN